MPSTAMMIHLVSTYGYPVLFLVVLVASAGIPLPVAIVLAAMGAVSTQLHGPNLLALILIGIAASISGDVTDYTLGRLGGPHVLRRLRKVSGEEELITRINRRWERRGLLVLISRFALTPLAVPVSLLAGASRFAFLAFLTWDAIGEAIFVVGYVLLGRLFGVGLIEGGPLPVIIVVVGLVLAAAPLVPVVWRKVKRSGKNHDDTSKGNATGNAKQAVAPVDAV